MNNMTAVVLVAVCALGVAGFLGSKYLDKCGKGTERYQSLGADICIDSSDAAILRCLETKASSYDVKLKRGGVGDFSLVLDKQKMAAKLGSQNELDAKIAIAEKHLGAAIASCQQLRKGIDAKAFDSPGAVIDIQVQN